MDLWGGKEIEERIMSNIITLRMNNEKIIDIGMDLMVQCIKFNVEEKIEDPHITLSLNILGIVYSVQVPKHEANDPHNIKCAWEQLIQDFGVMHMMGQSKRVQDGHRDLTEEESKIMEEKKNAPK